MTPISFRKSVVLASIAWVLVMGAGSLHSRRFEPSFCGGVEYNESLCLDEERGREAREIGVIVTVAPPVIFLLIAFFWRRKLGQ
jgi:hypothetical protein